ncbi:dienelactone hydrolase family protein [Schlesneria paludicola]|uniref:dienelactone hydrolase family protein n=1 Tax=Schlesneria paludicola TaxID=360056 RepID=UPI00029A4D3F|nr:dienelactone hydrolase family protein [Schlesneria paludicola]
MRFVIPWFVASLFIAGQGLLNADEATRPPRPVPGDPMTRGRFLKLIDRPRSPLDPREQPESHEQNLIEQHFTFNSEAGEVVPGRLVKPVSSHGLCPTVIVLHGTGGSKDAMRPLLRRLASRGLTAVAIDARYSGERLNGEKGADSYRAAIFETWKSGNKFPFLYDTVWDTLRLIDYLETRRDINPKKIGGIGFSKGGTELYLAAATDTRLAAVVPCIGVQSFGWALSHDAWHSRIGTIQSAVDAAARDAGVTTLDAKFIRRFYDRVVPGICDVFDGPAMLPAIAPRPLLVINGDRDDRTPLGGLNLCIESARAAYVQAGASDQFECLLQPNTGHAVTPQSENYAIDWLIQKLAPDANSSVHR